MAENLLNTTASHMTDNSSSLNTTIKMSFPCNTCGLVFDNSAAQRAHMREPWHVHNLRRRTETLPPISADTYAEQTATSIVQRKRKSKIAATATEVVAEPELDKKYVGETSSLPSLEGREAQENCCLFCMRTSDRLDTNIQHMSSEHGLYVPEIELLSSPEVFIGFLGTIIAEYNECLYCGMVKQSAEGVRRHMLDKGHCMINLEREPELIEFWNLSSDDSGEDDDSLDGDNDDDEEALQPSTRQKPTTTAFDSLCDEHILPSGRIIGSKNKTRELRRLAHRTAAATAARKTSNQRILNEPNNTIHTANTPSATELDTGRSLTRHPQTPNHPTNQISSAITVRDLTGLTGVSTQQLRSLTTIHRKTQRQQAIVQASAAWADELGGRSQKHFKVKMNLRAG